MTEPIPHYRPHIDLDNPSGSGAWLAYLGEVVLAALYWFLLVIPLFGSKSDPNCRVRCPDLDLSWYPLSFDQGVGSVHETAIATFTYAPFVAVPLLIGLTIHLVSGWKRISVPPRVARAAILILLGTGLIITYARFTDITGWLSI